MKALLCSVLLLLTCSTTVVRAQEFGMPSGHSNGLVRPAFKIVPKLRFQNLGPEKHLLLNMDVELSTPMNPSPTFSYRYMHMGKEYTDRDLGFDPFKSIRLGTASFTVLVQGPNMNQRITYEVDLTSDLGIVPKDAVLMTYHANVMSLDGVFYNGTESMVSAINQFEQAKKDLARKTEEAAKPKPSNEVTSVQKTTNTPTNTNSTTGSNNSTASSKTNTSSNDDFWSEKKTTATNNSGNNSSQFGKPIPEQPGHKNLPDLVRTTDGGYFQRGEDGRFRQVTPEDYQKAKDAAAAKNQTTATGQQQQPKMSDAEIKATVDKMFTDAAAKNAAIYEGVSRATNMIAQNFYYAEAIRNGKQNLAELSSLSGNYSSIQQLEADFNQKYSSIRGEVSAIESNRNAALNNSVNAMFNGNSTEQAVGQGMKLLGSIINSAKANKEEKEAKERLRIAREQQIAAIKAAKQKARIDLRNQLMKSFPNGGTPLSAHKITASEVYMFGYIIDPAVITSETGNISVSNVFPVAQYSDGSFPLRTSVSSKLQGIARGDVVMVGYYTDKNAAEQMRKSFIGLAQKSELAVNNVVLKTLSGSTGSAAKVSGDFWESGQKPKAAVADTAVKKKDSFWNN